MKSAVTKTLVLIWVGIGVVLLVMKDRDTGLASLALQFLVVWLVCTLVGLAAFDFVRRGPFERMSAKDRRRAVEIQMNYLRSAEEDAWLEEKMRKFAPKADQKRQFADALFRAIALTEAESSKRFNGPSVVLARRARRPGFDVTRDGTIWFGGLPALGDEMWPRGSNGKLMTPLAQIDLTGLAPHLRVPGLPNKGSLAFFASFGESGDDTFAGTVRYVPGPTPKPTDPDGPLPVVENYTFGGALRRNEPAEGQVLFPRMAIELLPVTGTGADLRAEVEAALGPARKKNLHVGIAGDESPGPGQPYNRDSLLRFLHGARLALGAGEAVEKTLHRSLTSLPKFRDEWAAELEANPDRRDEAQAGLERVQAEIRRVEDMLARLDAAAATLGASLEVLETWARRGDRWQALTEADQVHLAPLLHDWTNGHGLGHAHLDETHEVRKRMGDCVTETLLVMAVAEDKVFDALPEPLRDAINGPYRQPRPGVFHKMFGEPSSIQEAASLNQGSYLLLQLQCDDLAGFYWGDMGVLQFWITPSALKAGRWEEAYLTFEHN